MMRFFFIAVLLTSFLYSNSGYAGLGCGGSGFGGMTGEAKIKKHNERLEKIFYAGIVKNIGGTDDYYIFKNLQTFHGSDEPEFKVFKDKATHSENYTLPSKGKVFEIYIHQMSEQRYTEMREKHERGRSSNYRSFGHVEVGEFYLPFLCFGYVLLWDDLRKNAAPSKALDAEKQSCSDQGGVWEFYLSFKNRGQYICAMPTSDAGKVCRKYTDCENMCVVDLTWHEYLQDQEYSKWERNIGWNDLCKDNPDGLLCDENTRPKFDFTIDNFKNCEEDANAKGCGGIFDTSIYEVACPAPVIKNGVCSKYINFYDTFYEKKSNMMVWWNNKYGFLDFQFDDFQFDKFSEKQN